jgi:hypothetical protein
LVTLKSNKMKKQYLCIFLTILLYSCQERSEIAKDTPTVTASPSAFDTLAPLERLAEIAKYVTNRTNIIFLCILIGYRFNKVV